eukprot:c9605_g2_i2.p1 GENE.c9605_g2_i2~~c9605_g2_i2.p1  ORF type:complete len:316 (-),score=84.04 c9605_g2_i2:80-1027(-)
MMGGMGMGMGMGMNAMGMNAMASMGMGMGMGMGGSMNAMGLGMNQAATSPGLALAQAAMAQQSMMPHQQPGGIPSVAHPTPRIYVGSIHFDLTEEDIKTVFSTFGPIKSCQLIRDVATGRHKGYGFIEYDTAQIAEEAIAQMHNFELAGRQLKVGRATATGTGSLMPPMMGMGGVPGMGMPGAFANQDNSGTIQREENPQISGNQRFMLMQSLNRADDIQSTASRCTVLKNMVDPEDVDDDLKQEVREECSKYGSVEDVVVHIGSPTSALIFVLFSTAIEAAKALQSLNGRWFGGRMITAEYFPEKKFVAKEFSF